MDAKIIDGKKFSHKRLNLVKNEVYNRIKNGLKRPCLSVILIGDDPASKIYVKNKKNACNEVGITSLSFEKDSNFTQEELLNLINDLNNDEKVDGILIQLPLPNHINTQKIIESLRPDKDVDGFHPYNIGRLALRIPVITPCTPKGVMNLLKDSNIDVKGKRVTIVGASNIVGRPQALEMLLAGATITICHYFTTEDNLKKAISDAQILVVAVGKPNFIKGEWITPGTVVIDVGINRKEDGLICGDVEFDRAKEVASYITPVPGGVGPMTITTLLENTLTLAKMHD